MNLFYNLGMVEIVRLKSKYMHGVMEQNTYVLLKGKFALIIDAGAEIEEVKEVIGKRMVVGVMLTHLHFDHFWYVEKYVEEFDTEAYVVEGYENKFSDAVLNGSYLIRQQIEKNVSKKRIKYYAKNDINIWLWFTQKIS